MLGCAVSWYMHTMFGKQSVVTTVRPSATGILPSNMQVIPFDPVHDFLSSLPEAEFVINCIGAIKPVIAGNPVDAIYLNSIFPRKLSEQCKKRGEKLIHITTDCVFSGKDGKYTEHSPHDCDDVYGKTKSLGEPDDCMVLRTSIIGNELCHGRSLVEWYRGAVKQNCEIKGFTNHLWNGVTTGQYAEICGKIIRLCMYRTGLFHVFSPEDVSKYTLLCMLSKSVGFTGEVKPVEFGTGCDRTLRTAKELCKSLHIPPLSYQIKEQLGGIPKGELP